MPQVTLSRIAALLQISPPDTDVTIQGVAYLAEAKPGELSFINSEKFLSDLTKTKASAVLVKKGIALPAESAAVAIVVDDADVAIGRVLELFAPPRQALAAGIDPSAKVARSASVDPSARIGPNVVVGERTQIGAGTILHANVYLGDDVTLGSQCEFFPSVVIRERISIGHRVVIHAGTIIGTDGFGYRWDGKQHAKIPHIGTVIIEDDVEIGSCSCIDRGKFGATKIGCGTKIDNLVQVAHNCQVGPFCILVGQCGLAGSAKLGAGVVIAGQAAIRDHISIGDQATVTACAGVMNDVDPKTIVSGLPAQPHRMAIKEQLALRKLPDLIQQVKELQLQIEALKTAKSSQAENNESQINP